ncbi:hypothetical protein DICVIV_06043 [Dictyocaulus viviparus]|uniref:BBSome complex member BBS5 PH domain-containing protein n=1 Tax=Dictyocaulus viviparus TaxID=29172 RepID=A0A0D8XTB0_DICVI|nr:hypothetical protein DICVIV_06043 [Dictyocaulus viviparus]
MKYFRKHYTVSIFQLSICFQYNIHAQATSTSWSSLVSISQLISCSMLRLVPGEVQVSRVDMVEDTKGNNGDRGVMRVTNLRLIWYASSMPRINLSIGYSNITGLQSREIISRICGTEVEALYVMARVPNFSTKFEFIFTAMTSGMHSKLFNTVSSVHRAYETTKLYRELKMRGAIMDEKHNLKLLPLEQLIENVAGVWNLSTDQSGEYVLGFRIDPIERLQQVCKAIQALHKAANVHPIFGVTFHKDKHFSPRGDNTEQENELEEDEFEAKNSRTDAFAAYFSDGSSTSEERRPPVFSEELGLAVEQLKTGFSLADLWNIYID